MQQTLLTKSKIMITLLKMIIHVKLEQQTDFFTQIESMYKEEDNKFSQFLSYFKKNWLQHIFIQTPGSTNTFFARTNNCCESFHSKLNNLIPHKRPRAALLIDILKTIEFEYRQLIVAASQGQISAPSVSNSITLPFDQLYLMTQSLLPKT